MKNERANTNTSSAQEIFEDGLRCHSITLKHASIQEGSRQEDAKQAAQVMVNGHSKPSVVDAQELAQETTNVMFTKNVTIYDALYKAASQIPNVTFCTADQKLHHSQNTHKHKAARNLQTHNHGHGVNSHSETITTNSSTSVEEEGTKFFCVIPSFNSRRFSLSPAVTIASESSQDSC